MKTSYNQATASNLENVMDFSITKKMLKINTMTLCRVVAVNDRTLDIEPLILSVDTEDNALDAPIIYDAAVSTTRGGDAGIIIEYKVGDVVIVGFCSRNIDVTKNTLKQSKPEDARTYDLRDAVVLGHYALEQPTTYIKITDGGIEINTGKNVVAKCNNLTATASKIDLVGATSITGNTSIIGNLSVTGAISSAVSVTAPIISGGGTVISSAGLVTADGLALDSVTYRAHIHSGGTVQPNGTTGGVI